uniref:Uncharacterized protein n=1 Tax=Grammatophora oceanica TaxID=210454 RepID=A0A7S1VBP0_9STRA|mmetsp:Transcript_40862/g.60554  ORF Transcript_40862/g.60554 Transcript_40862/m.60554 type:complete len:124 (+) Transcript_40862:75-446(+)|eukprot:CAMPEP_0194048732 /NCGR_PEP_ID=MMETSP0009_2-20130614/28297_1 /TAXON_ID=210454 /ORGANISM="Grammatophora oceanica, Strain CCMP 410" /LENGTH=123 /DNA_ID=CAMNT_0038694685 /DNA_START=73 /DNA_END=444 /DNA_ORIENTATION=+
MPFFLAPLIVGGAVYYANKRKNEDSEEGSTEEKPQDEQSETEDAEMIGNKTDDSPSSPPEMSSNSTGGEAVTLLGSLNRTEAMSKINRFLFPTQIESSIQTDGSTDTFRMMDKEVKFPKISYK